jgi:hypothetical protein
MAPEKTAQIANIVFVLACLVLVPLTVWRFWSTPDTRHAREDFLENGTLLGGASRPSMDDDPRLLVFLRSSCSFCTESMPFYKQLRESAATSGARWRLYFVSDEPPSALVAYLRSGGVDGATVLSGAFPSAIRGTPSLVLLDGRGAVKASWQGVASRRQESGILSLLNGIH